MKDADDTTSGRDVPTGVVMVGIVVVAWWPAFTLGAWGEIFFDDILALWAASSAAFVFVLIDKRPVGARLARAFVLLLPTVWILLNFFVVDDTTTAIWIVILDVAALAAVLVGIPFTLWVLVRIAWPDVTRNTTRRAKWIITAVVFAVVAASYVLGLNQSRFLTCEDFTISGNSQPPGCTPASSRAVVAE